MVPPIALPRGVVSFSRGAPMGRRPVFSALPASYRVRLRGGGEVGRYAPTGSPMGERRPPVPLFSSCDSVSTGMCSLLLDMVVDWFLD